jgi:hypothetical protein
MSNTAIPPLKPTLFRDIAPSYMPRREWDRASVRALGCSLDTILYLYPNPKTNGIILTPENWFWTDRKWFKGTSRQVQDEIYAIAGGCFGELALTEQVTLLDIPMVSISGSRATGEKGKWLGRSDRTLDIEAYALECLLGVGDHGQDCEGKAFSTIHTMTKKVFEHDQGHWMGWDRSNTQHYTPGLEYAEKVIAALRTVLDDPCGIYARLPRYFDTLFGVPINTAVEFISIVGRKHIEQLVRHSYTFGTNAIGGHPDLTISGKSLSFVEVKGKDKMHVNQAYWIRNIAKPLELNVCIAKVG